MSTLDSSPELFTTPNSSPPRETEVMESPDSLAIVPYNPRCDFEEMFRSIQSLPEVINLPWIDPCFNGRVFARRRKKTCNPNPPRVSPISSSQTLSPVETNTIPPTSSEPPLSPVRALSPTSSSDTPLIVGQTVGRRRSSRLTASQQQTKSQNKPKTTTKSQNKPKKKQNKRIV